MRSYIVVFSGQQQQHESIPVHLAVRMALIVERSLAQSPSNVM